MISSGFGALLDGTTRLYRLEATGELTGLQVTVLADGRDHRRTGTVVQAAAEDSDGGLARYRLPVVP